MVGKERKAVAPSVARKVLHDIEGTAVERMALFEKLKAAGGLDGEDPDQVRIRKRAELLAAVEKDRD